MTLCVRMEILISRLHIEKFDVCVFFFNDTATTEIYTLSLHDALPIFPGTSTWHSSCIASTRRSEVRPKRSEEHTSELQSPDHLVCRLLLEKKKNKIKKIHTKKKKKKQNKKQ